MPVSFQQSVAHKQSRYFLVLVMWLKWNSEWLRAALQLSMFSCEVLQILVFIVVILECARYTPIEQRLLDHFKYVEYASAATLAIIFLLYLFLSHISPFTDVHIVHIVLTLKSLTYGVSTSILLAASVLLKAISNPQRSESKVQPFIPTDSESQRMKSL